MNDLYAIYYNGEPVRMNGKKYVYFALEDAEKALKSIARRKVRLKINSWKDYTQAERKKIINDELVCFEVIKYVAENG